MSIILKNQVNNVQILRAIAAIWVVSYHTLLNLESDKIHVHLFSLIANKGLAGVDIFFVISGFIMMKTQIMHPRKPTEFYLKRLIRIVPMYYFVTMLYCSIFFVDPSLFGTFRFSLSWLIASLTFTSGLASLGPPIVILGWTLEFEILFYALLGVTSKFFKETKLMIVVSLLLILLVLFGVKVGLSDHTLGIGVSIAAIALGATAIEKHITLRRSDGGADGAFSMEPKEFAMLVAEGTSALQALGKSEWSMQESENESRRLRRSLYVVKDVKAGETVTQENVRAIRPGGGCSPKLFDDMMGKKFRGDFLKGTPMTHELLGMID
jgi:NeuB family/Acyltransferase family/SAF domain